MNCPACSAATTTTDLSGPSVEICAAGCGGMWLSGNALWAGVFLDASELLAIRRSEGTAAMPMPGKLMQDVAGNAQHVSWEVITRFLPF